jgi:hypothetical protein
MSVPAPAAAGLSTLCDLYARYKSLASAAGACLTLGQSLAALVAPAGALEAETRSAADSDSPLASPFAVCAAATRDLVELIGAHDGDDVSARLAAARASHRALRRQMWDMVECEYVPCCASAPHRPDRGQDDD